MSKSFTHLQKPRTTHTVCMFTLAGILLANSLQSQETTSQIIDLEAFIVSAQKREQSVFEVPININTFQGSFLESNLGVSEFSDLAPFVPGLEIQEQSPNNPGFVIRGITSDSGNAHIEPRVSVYLDGISISDTRTSVIELFDLDRVEVAKGPQSTLFGRAAEIGAISVIQTKANLHQYAGKISVGSGNFDELHTQGMLNMPLVEHKLGVRLAFSFHSREGYIDNITGEDHSQNPNTSGEPLNGLNNRSLKLALAYAPNENLRIDYIFNFQNDNPSGTSFKSKTYAPTGGDTSPNSAAELNLGTGLYIDRTILNHNITAKLRINDYWNFESITGYRTTDSYEKFDADGTAAPVLEFAEDVQHEQFSQELRLNYDNSSNFSAFFGFNFFYKNASQRVPFDTNEQNLLTLVSSMPAFQPIFIAFGMPINLPLILPTGEPFTPITVLPNPFSPGSFIVLKEAHHEEYINDSILKVYEAFVDGTYMVTEKLEITAGLRLSKEEVNSGYEVIDSPTPGIIGLLDQSRFPNNILVSTGGKRIAGEESFSGVVGRIAALYDFYEDSNLYVSIAKGRRPNVLVADATGTSILSDESVWNYEFGIKGLLAEKRISYDLSIFQYNYHNFQTTIPNDNPPPLFLQVDAGNATGRGLELSMFATINRFVSVFGNYAYIDATYDDKDDDGNPQQLSGNRFRLTPEQSFAVGVEMSAEISDNMTIFIIPNYTWKSDVFFEDNNDPALSQEAYGLLNLRAGCLFGKDLSWEATFYMNNVLDEEYIIDAGNTGNTFGIPTYISGPPTFYGFKLSKSF